MSHVKLLVSDRARRESSLSRPWPCAPAHRLVSGEGGTLPQTKIGIHVDQEPEGFGGDQSTSGLRRSHQSCRLPTASPHRGKIQMDAQAFRLAPSGMTPASRKRQNAMASFRAK